MMETKTKFLGMVGYMESETPSRRPFMSMGIGASGIKDTDEACEIALSANLHHFFLIPRPEGEGSGHMGFIRDKDIRRGYRNVPTREAVLISLIQPGPYLLADLKKK